jgi:hypothetical protein
MPWNVTAGPRRLAAACRPGSVGGLAGLLALAFLFALAWTALPGRVNDLEHQGIDIVNHAVLVHRRAHPVAPTLMGYHGAYPQAAHALAGALVPWLGDNAIRAMDCAAWMILLGLLACQYTLLCRRLPPLPALAVLAGWQALCAATLFGDRDFFSTNYFYPQAAGTLACWLQMVVLSTPADSGPGRLLRDGLALLAAALAYACHIVPGAAAFATLALVQGYRLFGRERGEALLGLLVIGLTAVHLVLGSSQIQLMGHARLRGDYWLPYKYLGLLLLWVPTALAAGAWLVRGLVRGRPPRPDNLNVVLSCALLAAGALQGYLALETVLGVAGGYYNAKKLFFLTFPLAGLLWVCGPAGRLSGRGWPGPVRSPAARAALATGCLLAALIGLGFWLGRDPRRPGRARPGRDPVATSRVLAELRPQVPTRTYFHDPASPMNALFASVTGLEMNHDAALHCWESLYLKWDHLGLKEYPIWFLVDFGVVAHLLLPPGEAPAAVLGKQVHTESAHPFVRCDLSRDRPPGPHPGVP